MKDNVNQHGFGLGLSICKKIINAGHGEITCQSTLDEGTKFLIALPYEKVYHLKFKLI